jgi:hypothetical protein
MSEQVKVSTVADVIKSLQQMPQDAPIYFDCHFCGKSNGFQKLGIAVMVSTKGNND